MTTTNIAMSVCALTSRKNFVNFGPVTPAMTGLSFVNFCHDKAKISISKQISQSVLDQYSANFLDWWTYGWQ